MSILPDLMSDLAMILVTAGIATLICRKFNQPLVLGYLVAGFLTGPNFYLFPTIANINNIDLWGDIGIIFLLFSLGLDFSLGKIQKVGKTALITVAVELVFFFGLGYFAGFLLDWSTPNCIFLGSLLSMSSTAVVIKAFDDLNMRTAPFVSSVFGLLIMEDMVGIIVMVLLSTCATSGLAGLSGSTIVGAIANLVLFITICGLMAIYLLPTFFRKAAKLFTDEVSLIAGLGLCFSMVVLCAYLNFSTALGAFITGSLLTATADTEKLKKLLEPLQYLFGAVFFISVGMMVEPSMVLTYKWPILLCVLTVYLGKTLFTSLGFLISGQTLKNALGGGFALTQIGEFSIIAANLGIDLKVLDAPIDSVMVVSSVITICTTPLFIKGANPFYELLERRLPKETMEKINSYSAPPSTKDDKNKTWSKFLHAFFLKVLLYFIICSTICILATYAIFPYCRHLLNSPYGDILGGLFSLLILSPFLRMLLTNTKKTNKLANLLWFEKKSNHLPLTALFGLKAILAFGFIHFIIEEMIDLPIYICLPLTLLLAFLIGSSTKLLEEYATMEARFIINFNNQEYLDDVATELKAGQQKALQDIDTKLYFQQYEVKLAASIVGHSLRELASRETYGYNILQITKADGTVITIPGPNDLLEAGDQLLLLGTKEQFALFEASAAIKNFTLDTSLKSLTGLNLQEYLDNTRNTLNDEDCFYPCVIYIDKKSPWFNKSLRSSALRQSWHALAIGLERNNYVTINPNVALLMEQNDLLWLIGKKPMLEALIQEGVF